MLYKEIIAHCTILFVFSFSQVTIADKELKTSTEAMLASRPISLSMFSRSSPLALLYVVSQASTSVITPSASMMGTGGTGSLSLKEEGISDGSISASLVASKVKLDSPGNPEPDGA